MPSRFDFLACSLGLLLICATPAQSSTQTQITPQPTVKSTKITTYTGVAAEVDKMAQQVTVLINSQTQGNGSGAIVAKQGNIYYVLTAGHVISKPEAYQIITPDGQKYPLDYRTVTQFEGVDLALLQFTSSKSYAVATLADYDVGLEDRAVVFLSGFPGVKSGTPTRKLTAGTVASQAVTQFLAQNAYSMANGYGLIYTSLTQPGMSGGPIFDRFGRIIGINAASEAEWTITDEGENFAIFLGRSLGVPIGTFLGAGNKGTLNGKLLKVETSVPSNLSELRRNNILQQSVFNESMPSEKANALEWLNWGNQQWRIGKYRESVQAFDRAIARKSDFYQAYYAKGVALYGQEKYSEAVAAFDRANQINPGIYEIWRLKAVTLQQIKKYPESLAAIDRAIQLNPSDAVLYIYRGNALEALKRYEEAKNTYTKAIEINPTYFAYSFRGNAYFNLRDYRNSLADYNKLVELQPNSFFSYVGRGTINFALGDAQAALTDYTKAIALAPANHKLVPVLYQGRGMLLLTAGDYQGAIADCTKTIESNTDETTTLLAHECRAQAYANSGDVQKAIAEYTEIIANQPQNAKAYFNRASYRGQSNDFQGALADFSKAIEIKPDYADAYRFRSTIRNILQDPQGGIDDAKKAAELYSQQIDSDPNNINLYTSRAISRISYGDKQGANQDLDRAEQLAKEQGLGNLQLIEELRKLIRE